MPSRDVLVNVVLAVRHRLSTRRAPDTDSRMAAFDVACGRRFFASLRLKSFSARCGAVWQSRTNWKHAGTAVFARSDRDGRWYEALVTSALPNEQYYVKFSATGRGQVCRDDDIRVGGAVSATPQQQQPQFVLPPPPHQQPVLLASTSTMQMQMPLSPPPQGRPPSLV